nr:hypothetical protein [uncultured Mediterranean phage uvMED]BAR25540.1 hypothetical protein [uncultured Mediterranean phage uvMED]
MDKEITEIFGGGMNLQKLVDELEDLYPAITHSPKDQLSEIMYRSGQRSVVEFIKDKLVKD